MVSFSDSELDRVMRAASQLPNKSEFLECTVAYFERLQDLDAAIALATSYVLQKFAGTARA